MIKIDHNNQVRAIRKDKKDAKKKKFALPAECGRYRKARFFGKEAEDVFKSGKVLWSCGGG